jgi:hypothetical protein
VAGGCSLFSSCLHRRFVGSEKGRLSAIGQIRTFRRPFRNCGKKAKTKTKPPEREFIPDVMFGEVLAELRC